ncbi:MAG: cytochrome C peroxidase, partial [Calditrichaeota bacterium]
MYCKCHNIYIYLVLILCFSLSGLAQNPNAPPPLSTLPIPEPSNLGDFVKNKQKAIELGKALFWDMQAGGDGVQACASCHFQAGADVRIKNQLSPHGAPPATDPGASFEVGGPNYTVQRADFPFRELSDPEDRNSTVLFDSDDVFSSQGVFDAMFNDIIPGAAADDMTFVADPVFNVNGINTRRVEPRNTPPVINAVFFVDNFWDGRAKFFFNGVNPFGNLDPNARILEKQPDGSVIPVAILIDRASLASQAVGPPLSDFEMASAGKAFPKIGKKLFSVTPLGLQKVHPNDSVLGYLSLWPNPGISVDYATLIQEAFQNKYWDSDKVFDINRNEIGTGAPSNTNEYNLMEMNFSLFWGLAIQLYEATLVSDQTPYDDFQMGNNNALTAEQKEGLTIFLNQGKCINCHSGAEFAGGTIDQLIDNPVEVNGDLEGIIERMNMAQGQAIYDAGFYNIGVRPTGEDIGRGGTALGEPLSFSRFAKLHGQDAIGIPLNLNPAVDPNERDAVDGAFKTSSLRNIELTGPYFHNGGQATLLEVVQFYTRGGDFHDANIDNLDPDINVIGHIRGKPHRQRALAAFMLALTDERVVYQRAPFDHPQIFLPHGHPGDESSIAGTDPFGNAISDLVEFPAVGAEGASFALKPFLDADQLGP